MLSRAALIKAATPVSGNRTGIAEKQFSKELVNYFSAETHPD